MVETETSMCNLYEKRGSITLSFSYFKTARFRVEWKPNLIFFFKIQIIVDYSQRMF